MAIDDTVTPPTVERLILEGFIQNVGKVFGAAQPIFLSTTDRYRVADIIAKQQGENVSYPFAFAHITGVDDWESGTGYNTGSLLRHGGYTNVTSDTSLQLSIYPVRFDIELMFLTDDFDKALIFMNQWKYAGRKGKLNTTVVYGGLNIDVRVFLDTNLASPDKDNTVDTINAYEYSGILHINGYMSSMDSDDVKEVSMISGSKLAVFDNAGNPVFNPNV